MSTIPFNLPQSGGQLLGKGVYGCTFEPLPRCAGGDVFKPRQGERLVGKVTVEDTREELEIGRAIMAISPKLSPLYFALPTERCAPAMPLQDPDVARCDIIEEAPRGSRFSMLVMPAAGEQLVKTMVQKERMAAHFLPIFRHLLEGMILYQDAGYVHNDIHMGNVLVDERNVARFIDFGLAFRPTEVRVWEDANIGTKFKPAFIWLSPELHAWRMYKSGVRLRDGVEQLYENNADFRKFERLQGAPNSLLDTLQDVMTNIRTDVELLRRFGKRFDSWRIGYCMFLVWDELVQWSGVMRTDLWSSRDVVRKVIAGLTAFDVRRRLTAREALLLLDPKSRMASTPEPSGDETPRGRV
jgi:hypothetical protein